MKLDVKICYVALVGFALGFLFCLAVIERSPKPKPPTPLVGSRPVLSATQLPAWPKHLIFLPTHQEKLATPPALVRSPAEEIQMMNNRSLHLIDRER